jgi:hypothetical protein
MLGLSPLHADIYILDFAVFCGIVAFDNKEILPVRHHLTVNIRKAAVTKRQVIHRVQEIGLAFAVIPYQTIDFGREIEFGRMDILIIDDGNLL